MIAVVIALICAVTPALIVALVPGMSAARLWDSLYAFALGDGWIPRQALDPSTVAFVLGLGFGWLSALIWVGTRLRQGSLLLISSRAPDMPFCEAVAHVLRCSGTSLSSDTEAAAVILHAAGRNRLGVWRRNTSNGVERVPKHQIDSISGADATRVGSPAIDSQLLLIRSEVRRLWPVRRLIDVKPGRITFSSAK